jgi:hypothetical protein
MLSSDIDVHARQPTMHQTDSSALRATADDSTVERGPSAGIGKNTNADLLTVPAGLAPMAGPAWRPTVGQEAPNGAVVHPGVTPNGPEIPELGDGSPIERKGTLELSHPSRRLIGSGLYIDIETDANNNQGS